LKARASGARDSNFRRSVLAPADCGKPPMKPWLDEGIGFIKLGSRAPGSAHRLRAVATIMLTMIPERIAIFRERDLVRFAYSSNEPPVYRLRPPLHWQENSALREFIEKRGSSAVDYADDACLGALFACADLSEITRPRIQQCLQFAEEMRGDPEYKRNRDREDEVLRLMREKTCRYCNAPMDAVAYFGESVLLCATCGYWGGRGERNGGPVNCRGALGVVHRVDINSSDLRLVELVGHLRRVPNHLLQLSPRRAEQVVMDVLHEVLDCEVKPVGGVKDGGVDGYIVSGDTLKTIVQVKWHREPKRAESVRLIREIAGTLVARGVPSGLLVTTCERISREAGTEIKTFATREIVGLGALRIDVKTYQDLLDMLELAWAQLGSTFVSAVPWLSEDKRDELFD